MLTRCGDLAGKRSAYHLKIKKMIVLASLCGADATRPRFDHLEFRACPV